MPLAHPGAAAAAPRVLGNLTHDPRCAGMGTCCDIHFFAMDIGGSQLLLLAMIQTVVLVTSLVVLLCKLNSIYGRTVRAQRAPIDRLLRVRGTQRKELPNASRGEGVTSPMAGDYADVEGGSTPREGEDDDAPRRAAAATAVAAYGTSITPKSASHAAVSTAIAKRPVALLPSYYSVAVLAALLFGFQIIVYLPPNPSDVVRDLRFVSFALCSFVDNLPIFLLIRRDRGGTNGTFAVAASGFIVVAYLVYVLAIPTSSECSFCGVHFPKPGIQFAYAIATTFYILAAVLSRRRKRTCGLVFRPAMTAWAINMAIPYGGSVGAISMLQYGHWDAGYCLLDSAALYYAVMYAFVLFQVFVSDSRYVARLDTLRVLTQLGGGPGSKLGFGGGSALAGESFMLGSGSGGTGTAGAPADTDELEMLVADSGARGLFGSSRERRSPRSGGGGGVTAPLLSGTTGSGTGGLAGVASHEIDAHKAGGDGSGARSYVPREVLSLLEDPAMNYISHEELVMSNRIGVGGYGAVYVAKWRGIDVAVKSLFAFGTKNAIEAVEDFLSEASVLSRLRHPNIVLFLGVCVDAGHQSLVTEYMERGSVFDIMYKSEEAAAIRRRAKAANRGAVADAGADAGAGAGAGRDGRADGGESGSSPIVPPLAITAPHTVLPWDRKLEVLKGCVRGMAYLHGRNPSVIHRDLKSGNLLVDSSWNVKVCDFGLSRCKEATATMTAIGTCQWSAPEVLNRDRYSERADVWSFGVIVWELITECLPYDGMSVIRIAHEVAYGQLQLPMPGGTPKPVVDLIRACTQYKPTDRPTFAELCEVVDKLAADMPAGRVAGGKLVVGGAEVAELPPFRGDAAAPEADGGRR